MLTTATCYCSSGHRHSDCTDYRAKQHLQHIDSNNFMYISSRRLLHSDLHAASSVSLHLRGHLNFISFSTEELAAAPEPGRHVACLSDALHLTGQPDCLSVPPHFDLRMLPLYLVAQRGHPLGQAVLCLRLHLVGLHLWMPHLGFEFGFLTVLPLLNPHLLPLIS